MPGLYPRQGSPSSTPAASSSVSSSITSTTTSTGTFSTRSATSTPASPTSQSSTTTSEFHIFPTPTGIPDDDSPRKSVSQLALEVLFGILAVSVLLSIVFCRARQVLRHGQPLSRMFARGRPRRSTSPSSRPFRHSSRYPNNHSRPQSFSDPTTPLRNSVILPSEPLHAALHSDSIFTIPDFNAPRGRRHTRAVQSTDTDAGGRRGGGPDPDDHGAGIEKETLPAYDGAANAPPRYAELILNGLSLLPRRTDERPDEMELSPVSRPQSLNSPPQREATQLSTMHPTTSIDGHGSTSSHGHDIQSRRTPPPSFDYATIQPAADTRQPSPPPPPPSHPNWTHVRGNSIADNTR